MLLRAIARIVASMLVWRIATARRGTGYRATSPNGAPAAPAPPPRIDPSTAAVRLRDAASLGWRVFAATVLVTATTLLVTGGVTLTVLSPRWLGIALLVLAAAALGAAVAEVAGERKLVRARRRRRNADALRRQVF